MTKQAYKEISFRPTQAHLPCRLVERNITHCISDEAAWKKVQKKIDQTKQRLSEVAQELKS